MAYIKGQKVLFSPVVNIGSTEPILSNTNFYGTWQMPAGINYITTNGGTSGVDYLKYQGTYTKNTSGSVIISEERYLTLINHNEIGLVAGDSSTSVIGRIGTTNNNWTLQDESSTYNHISSACYSYETFYGSTGNQINLFIFDNAEFDFTKIDESESPIQALKSSVGKSAVLFASQEDLNLEITSIVQNDVELLEDITTLVVKEDGTVKQYVNGLNVADMTYSISGKEITFVIESQELSLIYENENNVETLTNAEMGIALTKKYYPTKEKTIISNGTYSGNSDGGFAEVVVNVPDMLQQRVDATNSCEYLMAYFRGDNVDFLKDLDTSNVTIMKNMFFMCSKILTIPLLNTSNVINTEYMFKSCNAIKTIPLLDTSNVTNMYDMFRYCYNLEEIPPLNTRNVTVMYSMFDSCNKLKSIPPLDTSNVYNMNYMFLSCYEIETIPLLNMISVSTISGYGGCNDIFKSCYKLTNLTLKNIKANLQIGSGTTWGHLLTLESLINTVKELWDYSSGETTGTLTMGTANLEKITNTYVKLITPTAEQIADDPNIESKKPCEVCESTDEGAMTLEIYANLKGWELA